MPRKMKRSLRRTSPLAKRAYELATDLDTLSRRAMRLGQAIEDIEGIAAAYDRYMRGRQAREAAEGDGETE